jgi:polysaccharide chain length determinant protein (PEP-CTERM system associated)
MWRNGEINLHQVKRMLQGYWWILLTTTLLAASVGLGVAELLPKRFTSSTVVLVEPPTVSKEVVPTLMTEDLYHRLASMKEQILSRSRLQAIIEKLNLYAEDRGKKHIEDLVERLRDSIDVSLMQPMAGSVDRQPPGFHVNVTFNDPGIAQQICTEISSMFMEQNSVSRIDQATDTSKFLTKEVEDAKAKLDEQDAKLAQFKRQYLGSLPEEQQSNLSLLTALNTQLEAATQAVGRAQQDKAFNESLLNQQEATFKATLSGAQSPDWIDQQLALQQTLLSDLLSKYTPQHPDVIKLKAQIEDTKRKSAASADNKPSGASTQGVAHEPPQMQQFRARIKLDELSIADAIKHQGQIQDKIQQLQGRVQSSPMVEQQLKELTRNYQTASDMYNDLLKRQQNSSMVVHLENEKQSETFRVLDPPSFPMTPSFPSKILFLGGGAGAGLALGLGILYLLMLTDKAMYTEHDVELCLKLPVLTLVPNYELSAVNASGKRKKPSQLWDVFVAKP